MTEIPALIRGHWSAIENGTHYRRDVTLGEDACTTAARPAAALATLRNLANGLYELERERGRTKVDTLKSWCQQQTFSIPMYRDCSAVEPPRAEPSPIHRPCIDAATEDPGQRLGAKAVTSPRHAS